MTPDVFAVQLIALTGKPPQEVSDFLELPGAGKVLVLQGWRAAYAQQGPGGASTWNQIVDFLGMAATVAGDVVGLGAAVDWARRL